MSASVLSVPSSPSSTEAEIDPISRLVFTLSKRLARTPREGIERTIEEALEQMAAVIRADACQLMEFTGSGDVVHVFSVGKQVRAGAVRSVSPDETWLRDRLSLGEVVAVSEPDEFPAEASASREHARRTGACSILGVPGSVSGRVVCALVFSTFKTSNRWPNALVERVQLLSDVLAAAMQNRLTDVRRPVADVEEQNTRLKADNEYLKQELHSRLDFEEIVGESEALQVALRRLTQVAPTDSTVLLLGQTGTGKELFARALHERSRRHARTLVRVNCAALPPTLVDSEFFGHEKGAFTGAVSARQGRFELADGGTIFLDEIGDLAPEMQVKLLRVLQEGEFERVGSSRTRRVDVRIIAATHRNLEVEVAEGRFRADLYYRLSVYPIRVPSLQERPEDIPQLVWFFIHRRQRELGRRINHVPDALMQALVRHPWPGNVRELENVVERAMIATNGDTLQLDEALPFAAQKALPMPATENLDDIQRAHIESVLERCGGRINGVGNAAERLGIHPNTLRFRMKKLNVTPHTGRGRPVHAMRPN